MDDESEKSSNPMIFLFWIAIFAVWIFLIRKDAEPYVLKAGWVEVITAILLYFSSLYVEWRARCLDMPQITVDGASGSFNPSNSPQEVLDYYLVKGPDGKPRRVNFIWLVYGLGALDWPGFRKGCLGTLIVPKMQIDIRAKNHFGSTHVYLVPFIKLSPALKTFLDRNRDKYNLDIIKIGHHNVNFVSKDFDDADKDLLIEQLNEQVNKKSNMLSGDFDELEKAKHLTDILNPKPTFMDHVTSIFKRNPSADSQQQQ